jgi:hypothetical protein
LQINATIGFLERLRTEQGNLRKRKTKYLDMQNYPMQPPAVAAPLAKLSMTQKSLADLGILHS